jgi:hypothetical protein
MSTSKPAKEGALTWVETRALKAGSERLTLKVHWRKGQRGRRRDDNFSQPFSLPRDSAAASASSANRVLTAMNRRSRRDPKPSYGSVRSWEG